MIKSTVQATYIYIYLMQFIRPQIPPFWVGNKGLFYRFMLASVKPHQPHAMVFGFRH
jgi:hypothetical protein